MIFDGPAIVKGLKFPATVLNFHHLKMFFWSQIVQRSANIATIHVVFDIYLENSLKESARKKRGVSTAIQFQSETVLPKNLKDFLRNSANKTKLFSYLAEKDECMRFVDKDIFVTRLKGVTMCKSTSSESDSFCLESLSPSNREETDTQIILHASHCSKQGLKNIMIFTVDSDVIVIAVHFFDALSLDTLWIPVGVGKNVKFVACH